MVANPLYLALSAMLVQQTCATLGRTTLPVVAPAIIADLGLSPAVVGIFVSLASCAGIVTTLGCGSFILRHGALRMTQIGMLALAAGLATGAGAWLIFFAAAALLVGFGSAVSTPSSSHLLSRYATPEQAPLVFSIKQTGVPVGLTIAGVAAPFLVQEVGWRGALLAMAALCAVVAVALQPTRARFDEDRRPAQPFRVGDIRDTLTAVLHDRNLRRLAFCSFSFVGLQSIYSSFVVLFLYNAQGYGLATAGYVYSIGMAVAILARIAWGWLSGRVMAPRYVLALLGILMGAAAVALALVEPDWPLPAVIAVAVVLSATALSWHGVLLAEAARLAPPGRVGATTGGVLSFGDAAALLLPLAFSGTLAATGAYSLGFFLAAIPPFLVAGYLLMGKPASASEKITALPMNPTEGLDADQGRRSLAPPVFRGRALPPRSGHPDRGRGRLHALSGPPLGLQQDVDL